MLVETHFKTGCKGEVSIVCVNGCIVIDVKWMEKVNIKSCQYSKTSGDRVILHYMSYLFALCCLLWIICFFDFVTVDDIQFIEKSLYGNFSSKLATLNA